MRYHPYHATVPPPLAPPPRTASPLVSRLVSWSGVLPLTAFLLVHAATNARVLWGDAALARTATALGHVPGIALVVWILVGVPLAFHAGAGLWLVATRRALATPSPYPPAVRTALRWTGVGTAAFLALHVPELSSSARDDGGQAATILAAALSATSSGVPWRGLVYLAGVACVSFHASAGLWGAFATSERGRSSDRARRWAAWGAGGVGAGLCVVLGSIVVFYATGTRAFGTPERAISTEPCPTPPASSARSSEARGRTRDTPETAPARSN
ncbi:MAG TPA: hypothetical protein VKU41_28215 [Polyangiaceae bacterium]|nr:hypothetical protein [Polyangiaceae bacterium]